MALRAAACRKLHVFALRLQLFSRTTGVARVPLPRRLPTLARLPLPPRLVLQLQLQLRLLRSRWRVVALTAAEKRERSPRWKVCYPTTSLRVMLRLCVHKVLTATPLRLPPCCRCCRRMERQAPHRVPVHVVHTECASRSAPAPWRSRCKKSRRTAAAAGLRRTVGRATGTAGSTRDGSARRRLRPPSRAVVTRPAHWPN